VTRWILHCRELAGAVDAEQAFVDLFGSSTWAYWLDSSLVAGPARYSLVGDSGGPHGEVLTTDVLSTDVLSADVLRSGGTDRDAASIFDRLDQRLTERTAEPAAGLSSGLPPALAAGYVGYFGYELAAGEGAARSCPSPLPDAVWMSATRFVVVDHHENRTWVCELGRAGEVARWVDAAASRLRVGGPGLPPVHDVSGVDPEPALVRPRQRYLADIEACLDQLRSGESYEICLTNTVDLAYTGDPFAAYRRLRRINPAPYAAYLRLGDTHVLSASPERFLTVDVDGYAESRPIKGTSPRGGEPGVDALLSKELVTSAKNQAENLMIVDLLRNDLGRVCEPGTITVPEFLAVESYATVHQLVSTVRGRLRRGVTAAQAARACFPPGSMTGAPKLRTMEILARLETRARGIYSGALGMFSATGAADLSVVIRTAVVHDGRVTVGAGGAIVLDSDPGEEYDEMLLKAAVPLRAL
jgi:aminodeoxychorismate synthase component I